MGLSSIRELEVERGILASGRDEMYGCIFGRDSLITSLSLLSSYEKNKDPYVLGLVRKILMNLATLQGRSVNIKSGEEPGKCIHEFRPDRHEHLTARAEHPWYVYPDGAMRNYDTVDATPLFLMAVHAYHRAGGDADMVEALLPSVEMALDWILKYGDSNGDGFIDYRFDAARKYGGLTTQSWMDSHDSVFLDEGEDPAYPIAPVEVQAYAYAALRMWAEYFRTHGDEERAARCESQAQGLKHSFNEKFVLFEESSFSLAFGIDGNGRAMKSPRSSMGHVLWAAYWNREGTPECILNDDLIPRLVERLLQTDLFVPSAGIRTLSMLSKRFNANSYHNGSIWPHDTGMIAEGFSNFGFAEEADRVRRALIQAYMHFETPIELFAYDDTYAEYVSESGQRACRNQAWSAAALISALGAIAPGTQG